MFPDSDGMVRRFPNGFTTDGSFIASVPATLARMPDPHQGDEVRIDFGIDASGIPAMSAADILGGRADARLLQGRSVIVGALATELRDFYSVPRHGVIAGSVLQILAAETLMAGRDLVALDGTVVAIGTSGLLLLILLAAGLSQQIRIAPALIALAALAETLATTLYVRNGVIVPTAFIHIATAAILALRWMTMTDFFRDLLREATAKARMNRKVLQQVVRENFDAIIIADGAGNVRQVNPAARAIFDIAESAAGDGATIPDILPGQIAEEVELAIADVRNEGSHATELRTAASPGRAARPARSNTRSACPCSRAGMPPRRRRMRQSSSA